jgi:hypothetical protein
MQITVLCVTIQLFRKARKFPPITLNNTTYQKTETFTDTTITEHKRFFFFKVMVVVLVVVVALVVVVVHSFHLYSDNVDRQYIWNKALLKTLSVT